MRSLSRREKQQRLLNAAEDIFEGLTFGSCSAIYNPFESLDDTYRSLREDYADFFGFNSAAYADFFYVEDPKLARELLLLLYREVLNDDT